MPPSCQPCVFISYAHKDGAALATRLHQDLAIQFDIWLDTQRLTAGDIWSREIEDAIDHASVVVALLSTGSYVSDICRAEQQRALEKGKCVIPVRVQTDCDIPLYLQTRQWLDFSKPELYPEFLPRLIEGIEKQSGVTVSVELLVRYNNAPTLPENFVNRPELLEALRNTLFREGANRNIALTAMQGMGGIGKTVLAQALCRDEVVQQAFPDGIFWFAIGKESQLDFSSHIKNVPGLDRLLGPYEGEAACLAQYRDVLRKKAALIVVDDVWHASDVQPFLAESPRSRLLITTRDTSIGAWFGAREFTANLLTEAESRQVLAKWCGRSVAELPPQASEVIHECGYLPLALAMIGAQLRGRPLVLWNSVLDHLRKADLRKIKARFPEPHTTLFRAIQISVKALKPKARKRYVALAVMPEEIAIAPQVQQCIWGVDENEAAETAEQLVGLSLAQRDEPEGSIRLHDLQLDYVRAQYPDRDALPMLQAAVRLSSSVIAKDPGQFNSQMIGRLLSYKNNSAITRFMDRVVESSRSTWLQPLQPTLHPPGTALVRTLEGHSGIVDDVALSADGRLAISASSDRTLKVWDVDSGRSLCTLGGHSLPVRAVALTTDGQRAVSASVDGTLKVWHVTRGRELHTLRGHSASVNAVALSADGQLAVSGSEDQTLKVWDVESGCEIRTLRGHSASVNAVALSADGQLAVSGSEDQTLKVWDVDSGRELRTLRGHSADVYAVALSGDGRFAVSGSRDGTLTVWDVESGREERTLEGHSASVYAVVLGANGRQVASASSDRTVKVWEVESGREIVTFSGHAAAVLGVAMSGNGRRVISTSEDQTLKVWDVESGRSLGTPEAHSHFVTGVAVSGDGRRAVSASNDRTLKVWDVESGRELRTLRGHFAAVNGVALTEDGRFAVSASSDSTLKLWDVGAGYELGSLEGHLSMVLGIALSRDGHLAISASLDKTLKVWDVDSECEIRSLQGHSGSVNSVALSSDGRVAVSASGDGTLKVWDVESALELRTMKAHSISVNDVALSRDGRRAVSAGFDNTLKVWDVDSGCELRTLQGHSNEVLGVAVNVEGRRAVSASYDRTVRVWDIETGEAIAIFTCDSAARCCTFVSDQSIIVGDEGGRVHFLRLIEPRPEK